MIRTKRNEQWKNVEFDDKIAKNSKKFKISNTGRMLSWNDEKEVLIKPANVNGYLALSLKQERNGKTTSRYIHKLVAEHFMEQNDGIYVIHLNYDKSDNRVENLKWVTKREKEIHQFSNPEYINRPRTRTYSKLTEGRVRLIKRKINDPNRRTRMKMIAKQFGISEMQLYRIKTGENWGYVTE